MIRARRSDQDELVAKLNELSQNDERILNALQDQGGTQRRVEELLVAVLKVRIRGVAFLVFLTSIFSVCPRTRIRHFSSSQVLTKCKQCSATEVWRKPTYLADDLGRMGRHQSRSRLRFKFDKHYWSGLIWSSVHGPMECCGTYKPRFLTFT